MWADMSSNNGDNGMVWLCVIAIVGAGAWLYVQVKAFAVWAGLDMDSASSLLIRLAVLIILLALALWNGWFRNAAFYVPCGLLICLMPALDYWSVNMIDGIAISEPAWYGHAWIQLLGCVGLAGGGFWVSRQFE
jgi:hypothetical protein